MKAIALGKKADRFCDQWSVIGIWRYLNVLAFSNVFGTFGVTFKMYLIPFLYKHSRSAEFLALPKKRYGTTSTGNSLLFGVAISSCGQSWSLIRRFRRPIMVDSSLASSLIPAQWWPYFSWNDEKPPVNGKQNKTYNDLTILSYAHYQRW